MDDAKLKYIDVLRSNNLSVTNPRINVFEILYSFGLQTMKQLIDRSDGCDRASIYRTVSLLEDVGVISRIPQGFKYKIELSEIFLPHHHHIVCVKCGRQSDVEQQKLEQLLESIALSEGYSLISHKVELQGMCPRCLELV